VAGQAAGTATSQMVIINGLPTQVTSSVNLGMGMGRPKTVTTDTQGMFEFKDLPAGTYRLTASPGQYYAEYLGISYGAKKPNGPGSNDPGQPIQLADGQNFTAAIALPKGSVITGRVSDENGDPLARVQVYTMFYQPGSTRGQRSGQGSQTDDLGAFRLYGLAVGDYVVVAEGRNNTFVAQRAAGNRGDRQRPLTCSFPGTPDEGSAAFARALTARRPASIRMASAGSFTSRAVVSSGRDYRTPVQRSAHVGRSGSGIMNSFDLIDPQGHFQMRNILPGDYRLIVRRNMIRPPTDRGTPRTRAFAVMPIR
jgi:hypothetical protein